MPAFGNSMSQTNFTQYKTLTISHFMGRTFEKHLNYIPRTNLLHTRIYLHTKKQEIKT